MIEKMLFKSPEMKDPMSVVVYDIIPILDTNNVPKDYYFLAWGSKKEWISGPIRYLAPIQKLNE